MCNQSSYQYFCKKNICSKIKVTERDLTKETLHRHERHQIFIFKRNICKKWNAIVHTIIRIQKNINSILLMATRRLHKCCASIAHRRNEAPDVKHVNISPLFLNPTIALPNFVEDFAFYNYSLQLDLKVFNRIHVRFFWPGAKKEECFAMQASLWLRVRNVSVRCRQWMTCVCCDSLTAMDLLAVTFPLNRIMSLSNLSLWQPKSLCLFLFRT